MTARVVEGNDKYAAQKVTVKGTLKGELYLPWPAFPLRAGSVLIRPMTRRYEMGTSTVN
jgi:hypothetical protein